MNINISGRHVDITDSLRDYVTEKLSRLERHFDHLNQCQVTLIVEKSIQKAEAIVHVSGQDIHASAENDDMYAAIDAMTDKLDRQVLKYKEKTVSRQQGHA